MKNARFWIYWNDDFVKLTLRPGQTVRFWRTEEHEEGWSSTAEEYEHTGREICSRTYEDGTDCDGQMSVDTWHTCPVSDLAARWSAALGDLVPAWKLLDRDINDRSAVAMNY